MAQTMLNTVVLVFTLLAGLVVFLRLFTRGLVLHKAGAEDAWITFAMVSLSTNLMVWVLNSSSSGSVYRPHSHHSTAGFERSGNAYTGPNASYDDKLSQGEPQ